MNGINAPKVVECLGSDGNRYRQLAKSGNDDLRQDAVWIKTLLDMKLPFLVSIHRVKSVDFRSFVGGWRDGYWRKVQSGMSRLWRRI